MCLYLNGEEGEGLSSLTPFLLLERPRQDLSKDIAQAPKVVPVITRVSTVTLTTC